MSKGRASIEETAVTGGSLVADKRLRNKKFRGVSKK
jgi:hypothetical protein